MKKQNQDSIRFLGAAQTVTGSKHLLTIGDKTILVDCGLFQGEKELRLMNWENLPVNASEIDLVLLTHGHLDHCGYLPSLVKQGFKGPIWASAPTIDLARIVLYDSASIQEEDARRANEENYSQHSPALPLYTIQDVGVVDKMFCPQPPDTFIPVNENISCRFRYSGHILGACFIEIKTNNRTLVFSGDTGRTNDPILFDPQKPHHADILLMEATYGDRLHPPNSKTELARIVNETAAKSGTLIIPCFAIERSQLLLYLLTQLRDEQAIPALPIYFDSPMAMDTTGVFIKYPQWHQLDHAKLKAMHRDVRLVQSLKETYAAIRDQQPKIVIAGSGMATGGRVLAYLARFVGDENACILLAGYQAKGTRGRALQDGASEIKMFGKYFPVRASIQNLEGISAHADQNELLEWISQLEKAPEKIFIVHGEPDQCLALKQKIKEQYGYACVIPQLNDVYAL